MKLKLDIVVFLAALIAVALLVDAWRSARHDSQQLAATLAAQSSIIQQGADREKQRDSQFASALSSIETQKRTVRTPQQAAHALASVLPPLPLPVSVHDPDLSVPLPPGEVPSVSVSVPQPDVVPLYDELQDCRASALQNDSLKKDLSDEKARSAALQHERDAAVSVTRGGTFLVRLKRSAKWFVIGAASGAAIAAVARH